MVPEGDPTPAERTACKELGKQKSEAAKSNELYICGMQPLDQDDLFYDVVVARESLQCYDPRGIRVLRSNMPEI